MTYPKKLTQSVGTAVTILESMILEVCHLDLVRMHVTEPPRRVLMLIGWD